jgi:hypothetical protein
MIFCYFYAILIFFFWIVWIFLNFGAIIGNLLSIINIRILFKYSNKSKKIFNIRNKKIMTNICSAYLESLWNCYRIFVGKQLNWLNRDYYPGDKRRRNLLEWFANRNRLIPTDWQNDSSMVTSNVLNQNRVDCPVKFLK